MLAVRFHEEDRATVALLHRGRLYEGFHYFLMNRELLERRGLPLTCRARRGRS